MAPRSAAIIAARRGRLTAGRSRGTALRFTAAIAAAVATVVALVVTTVVALVAAAAASRFAALRRFTALRRFAARRLAAARMTVHAAQVAKGLGFVRAHTERNGAHQHDGQKQTIHRNTPCSEKRRKTHPIPAPATRPLGLLV